jgi:OOP family OmpA-OmpF porin
MVSLQKMPDEVTRFILEHNLVRADVQALEQPEPLQQAIMQVASLAMRSFAELAGQATTRDMLWDAGREAAAAGAGAAATSATGGNFLRKVLDDRYHGTISATAAKAGVSVVTVTYLLGLVPAAALVIIGNGGAEQHWTAQHLTEWLRPRHPAPVAQATSAPAPRPIPVPLPALAAIPSPPSWFAKPTNVLLVLMTVVAAAEFGYILTLRSGAGATAEMVAVATKSSAAAPALSSAETSSQYAVGSAATMSVARPSVMVPAVLRLKNGERQLISPASAESKLYRLLLDPSKHVNLADPTKDWIGLGRIQFEAGKSTFTNESLWQLSNIASILKRFPSAKVRIGDHTDNAGKPSTNRLLSQQRAEATKKALVSLGVPADHLIAMGYDALDTIAGGDTKEGRALKHSISLQVVQK